MYIILVYDILSDENGSRISRNIFKICKKYLTHIQKSVFEGEITPVLLRKLYLELRKYNPIFIKKIKSRTKTIHSQRQRLINNFQITSRKMARKRILGNRR